MGSFKNTAAQVPPPDCGIICLGCHLDTRIFLISSGDFSVQPDWELRSSVQFSSVAQSCPTLWDPMDCSTPGLPVHPQFPEFNQTHVHWVGDAIHPSHPLSSPSPPAHNLSHHQDLYKWVSSSHQVAKVLEFQLQISPSNEHPGLISFRMDWLDLLAVQGTLKSLFQYQSSKPSILQRSAFFRVQLSHPYMTTGKTIALKNYRVGLIKEETTRCRCPQRFEEKQPSHSLTQFPPSRMKTCFCQIWGPRKSPVKIIPPFLFDLNEVSHTKPKYSRFLALS